MKNNILKHINKAVGTFILLTFLSGCTKKFEDFSTPALSLTSELTLKLVPSAIGPIQTATYGGYQVAQNLSADAYCGYAMSPTNFAGGLNNLNYALVDGWNSNSQIVQYTDVMAPIKKMKELGAPTNLPEIWGVALILQVHAMNRVTDRFGPIPYTKAGTSLTTIPYDDQQSIYSLFFKQLDTATNNLRTFLTSNPLVKNKMGANDLIYGGDYIKWLKFANSLRLRLAMRIVKADATLAKQQGEIALAAPEGLLATNADNAFLSQSVGRNNDLYLITKGYNFDNMFNASLGTYLDGYNDPRAPFMSIPATQTGIAGKYVGIRIGADVTKGDYKKFATYNYLISFKQFDPQIVMNAAEIWFLKAEAALRGWTGAGDAKTNYETGITTSMGQYGANIGTYLNNTTSKQADYVDPLNAENNIQAVSSITIKWDDGASLEQKLERIITQKWLAIFPSGQEAWADYRRTGYPKLFPVARNFSNGTIDTQIQIRRLPYAISEKTNNATGYQSALAALGGPDNGGTRLWWDKAGPNF